MELSDAQVKINKLQEELDRTTIEAERLKKEVTQDEGVINTKKAESDKLAQNLKTLEMGSKQAVGAKIKVERTVQSKGKEISAEKQELMLKKRVAEQMALDAARIAQELAKLNREKADKEREIQDLKRKKDTLR